MKAFVFPGQGAQFSGMGKDLYDAYPEARTMMQRANEVLGFNLTEVMFEGTDEALPGRGICPSGGAAEGKGLRSGILFRLHL